MGSLFAKVMLVLSIVSPSTRLVSFFSALSLCLWPLLIEDRSTVSFYCFLFPYYVIIVPSVHSVPPCKPTALFRLSLFLASRVGATVPSVYGLYLVYRLSPFGQHMHASNHRELLPTVRIL